MAPSLSIVVPAYGEGSRIGQSLDRILAFLSSAGAPAEVIVVDDGSVDDTGRIAERYVPRFHQHGHSLRVLTNPTNRGKGFSVRRGVAEARGDVVLFTDADLSAPITEAPKLITPIVDGRADVVFGSRAIDRRLIGKRPPLFRDYGGRFFNLLMRAILRLPYKDTQCGFKAFRRASILPVFERQRIDRFGFDPEVLYIARKRGLRALEVPVVWNDSDETTVRFLRDATMMFLDLWRIRRNDIAGRYGE